MNYTVQFIIIGILFVIVIYYTWPRTQTESFDQTISTVDSSITNNNRCYNNLNTKISLTDAKISHNIPIDNSYYELWNQERIKEKNTQREKAIDILESGLQCVNYQNINQCMSVCSNTDSCSGFYIDNPNTCCMLLNPSLSTNHGLLNVPIDNTYQYANRDINIMVRNAEKSDGKLIFNKAGSDGFNNRYISNQSREDCKSLCPKCINGKCPEDYRCTNMISDPRYNQSCIITNEDRYDETKHKIFDNDQIPYLDDKYGLTDYPGYYARCTK